jgi:uncharacterized Zn finger protein
MRLRAARCFIYDGPALDPSRTLPEYRYCERCMMRTEHELVVDTRRYNPRGRGNYKCTKCGRVKSMRHLRPSSEIGY